MCFAWDSQIAFGKKEVEAMAVTIALSRRKSGGEKNKNRVSMNVRIKSAKLNDTAAFVYRNLSTECECIATNLHIVLLSQTAKRTAALTTARLWN
jgi:hypothetical protein